MTKESLFLMPSAEVFFLYRPLTACGSVDTAASRRRRLYALGGREHWPPSAAETPCPRRRAKGDRTPSMVSFPPLDSPKPSFALTHRRCSAKRELRELGSVRRVGFGRLLCPEFPLRYPPRITVRGHSVQGDSVPLRKAPLRSRIVPWSTRRHCGPLAFRRATEGSRVRGKMWGCQEGDKKPGGCLGPLLSPPPDGGHCARSPRA